MEDLVQYGTPLEVLDENNIHLSKAPKLSDQIVTDKQGKRRFHGAFTGGFSAGYFNSVGTKQGWAPSTFVSSRSKRAEKFQNDPTSFMDEEDLDDFGIASQRIQASSDYEDPLNRSTKRKRNEEWAGPIPGQPVLKDLLKPVNITIGMKFLMKLGWRPGQGIGPRISRREKKKAQKDKVAGVIYVGSSSESDDEDYQSESLAFAPDDVEDRLLLNVKSNLFGLGYKPLERSNVLGGNRDDDFSGSFRMTDNKKKLSIRGQAFGVGAFEEEDDDIYMKEDMSAYDFDLDSSEKNSRKKQGGSRWDLHISLIEQALEGFYLASKPFEKPQKAPLPSLPVDYKPLHVSHRRKFSHREVTNKERLTSDDRSRIIDNSPSFEVRAGVKKQEESNDNQINNSNKFVGESLQGEALSSDYKPFAANQEKQKRYEAYIGARGRERDNVFPSYMTDWEKEREKGEFQRAETFNRPLSFGMASRFTSAVHEDSENQLQEGLNDMKDKVQPDKEERVPFYTDELKDDMKAAKQKMFGRLTQCQIDWRPDKILSKRFNVPNPFPSSTYVGSQSSKKESFSIFSVLPTTQNTSMVPIPGPSTETASNISSTDEITANIDEDFGLKVPVTNPPTIDLFNAIFQDSSDSETEENGKVDTEVSLKVKMVNNDPNGESSKENLNILFKYGDKNAGFLLDDNPLEKKNKHHLQTSKQNLNVGKCNSESFKKEFESKGAEAKGIFKGIDFSVLNQYRSSQDKQEEEDNSKMTDTRRRDSNTSSQKTDTRQRRNSNSSSHSNDSSVDQESDEEYGPPLPPHMMDKIPSSSTHTFLVPPSSLSLKDIEKKLKKEKKQKKKHKHKHKKHKKESKHKR